MKKGWKAVGLVLGIAIVAFLALSYLGIIPYFPFLSAYTKVAVPLGNTAGYESAGINSKTVYTFGWRAGLEADPRAQDTSYFDVFPMHYSVDSNTGIAMPSSWGPTSYFAVSLGSSYYVGNASSYYGGIEIKVSEIHSDYIVLLVKPLQ